MKLSTARLGAVRDSRTDRLRPNGPPRRLLGGGRRRMVAAATAKVPQLPVITFQRLGTELGVHEPHAPGYRPRDPTRTALYGLVAEQHATFARVAAEAGGVLRYDATRSLGGTRRTAWSYESAVLRAHPSQFSKTRVAQFEAAPPHAQLVSLLRLSDARDDDTRYECR